MKGKEGGGLLAKKKYLSYEMEKQTEESENLEKNWMWAVNIFINLTLFVDKICSDIDMSYYIQLSLSILWMANI